jgi:Zinc dependent phospholipase C
MAASFVHFQVSKEALMRVFLNPNNAQYKKVNDNFPHFVLLGSVSPDYPYLANKVAGVDKKVSWGDILHNKNTTDNVSLGMDILNSIRDKTSDDFFVKLSWLMGYYSHIMTDVVVHPVVYRIIGGPYTKLPSQHTKCELFQDSILCHTLLNEDIYNYDYLKPLEVDCTDASKFLLTLDPIEKVIKEPIPTFWATILKENYPDDYKNDIPDINAWHRVFLELILLARKGHYIFGKSSIAQSLTYRGFNDIDDAEKDITFNEINLPDNTGEGDYQRKVFEKAVKTVSEGWNQLLQSFSSNQALKDFKDSLKNWCLDDGSLDHKTFELWKPGKTDDCTTSYLT